MITKKRMAELEEYALQSTSQMTEAEKTDITNADRGTEREKTRRISAKEAQRRLAAIELFSQQAPRTTEEEEALRSIRSCITEELRECDYRARRDAESPRRKGTKSTHEEAEDRHEDIRKIYLSMKKKHGSDTKRMSLISYTVQHFKAGRKSSPRNYRESTIKNATNGL